MAKTLKGRTQHPAYTAAVLKAKNPVLLKGEVVYESDTTRHKIGDGTTAWNALPYAKGDFDGPLAAEKVTQDATHRFVSDTEKTAWNGKAAKDLSNVTLTKTFSQNGYYKAPDGLMFQWGRLGTAPSGTSYLSRYVTFPTSFTATPFAVLITIEGQGDDTVEAGGVTDITVSGFYIKPRYIRDGGDQGNSGMAFQWMAIGRWK
ncbi:gp53-like domain-containing protein [Alistipes putredinis]|jgi:hypothetical protein|uniref:gp53-like domain-containing protein n=1 Tax=Alistipes putredinis TaxID=28117 RepID=UPI0020555984|nr:MAG TPA: hyaluronidase [Caudoviricetes sp.]